MDTKNCGCSSRLYKMVVQPALSMCGLWICVLSQQPWIPKPALCIHGFCITYGGLTVNDNNFFFLIIKYLKILSSSWEKGRHLTYVLVMNLGILYKLILLIIPKVYEANIIIFILQQSGSARSLCFGSHAYVLSVAVWHFIQHYHQT